MINGSGIHNICIVVTRYFGGTLLGTGGLVRAYTDASKAAIQKCETKLMQKIIPTKITANYTDMGKIQYILNNNDVNIVDTVFTDEVFFDLEIPSNINNRVTNEIIEATGARAVIEADDEVFG